MFVLYQWHKSSESKVKFRQASKHSKRVLEAAKLVCANKIKDSSTSQKLGSWDFWWIANSVHNKTKPAILPLFNDLEVLSCGSDQAKLFAKNLSRNSNLDDSCISLSVFSSRTNGKLHIISITLKLVKKVITYLDLPKASGSYCIPVVLLQDCEAEFPYILAEIFNMCLKESCFPYWWQVSLVLPVFKNDGGRCATKNYHCVGLLLRLVKYLKNL